MKLFVAVAMGAVALAGIGYYTNWQTALAIFALLWSNNIGESAD